MTPHGASVNKEVAAHLCLSVLTVVPGLFKKLSCKSFHEPSPVRISKPSRTSGRPQLALASDLRLHASDLTWRMNVGAGNVGPLLIKMSHRHRVINVVHY